MALLLIKRFGVDNFPLCLQAGMFEAVNSGVQSSHSDPRGQPGTSKAGNHPRQTTGGFHNIIRQVKPPSH